MHVGAQQAWREVGLRGAPRVCVLTGLLWEVFCVESSVVHYSF